MNQISILISKIICNISEAEAVSSQNLLPNVKKKKQVCEKLENEAEEARKELVEKQQAIQAKQDAALGGGEAAA